MCVSIDAFRKGVRTDDTTVLVTVNKLIECNLQLKNVNCIDVGAFIGVVTLMMANALNKSNVQNLCNYIKVFAKNLNNSAHNVQINLILHGVLG